MLCFSCRHACSYAVLWTPENLHAIVLTIQILASLKSHASASEWHTVATVLCFGDSALMCSKFRKEKKITPVVVPIITFFRVLHMKILLQSSAGEHGNIFVTWMGPQMENQWHCLKWQQFYAAAQAERRILSQMSTCELKRWNHSLCPGAPRDAEVSSVLILGGA